MLHGTENAGTNRSCIAMKDQQDEDRILLAELMGGPIWEAYISPGKHPECVDLPNPFTDANDDHAWLGWMWNKYDVSAETPGSSIKRQIYLRFREELYQLNGGYADGYKIGNYARAVLIAINTGSS